ncbi:MAG: hypothetical protein VKO39_08085 [Cyanobacteriota bacterium]|nr:hypothetical protein [Cyanobacteriota bacterium]
MTATVLNTVPAGSNTVLASVDPTTVLASEANSLKTRTLPLHADNSFDLNIQSMQPVSSVNTTYIVTSTSIPAVLPWKTRYESKNIYAFAVLRNDGSVATWGGPEYSDIYSADLDDLGSYLYTTQIFSSSSAFAALRSDGSVFAWGNPQGGGNSSGVDFDGPSNSLSVTNIFSTDLAFSALRSDGSVVTWGNPYAGGDSSAIDFDGPSNTLSVTQIVSNSTAFAALRSDGSVVTWGSSSGGGNSTGVDFDGLGNNLSVTQLFSTANAFAALRSDNSVVSWGAYSFSEGPGDSFADSSELDFDGPDNNLSITHIFSTVDAFAALRSDGSVVTWGSLNSGGNSADVDFDGLNNNLFVTKIFSTADAFAALRSDGSVVTWGDLYDDDDIDGIDFDGPSNNLYVTEIFSNHSAFAALRSDGSVIAWGHPFFGGDSSGVDFDGPNDNLSVTQVFFSSNAAAALRSDGSVVTWGDASAGGNSSSVDFDGANNNLSVTQIFSSAAAFAALRSDGSVVTWGDLYSGGNSSGVDFDGPSNNLSISHVFSVPTAFLARRNDGSVLTWGNATRGGDSTGVDFDGPSNTLSITEVFSNSFAVAAIRSDGSVVTWGDPFSGGDSIGVDFDGPANNLSVTQIFSTGSAFAALRSDGSVVTWGNSMRGGNSDSVDFDGPDNTLFTTQIVSTDSAFAALRNNGSVVTWGFATLGGNSAGVDFDGPSNNLSVINLFSNRYAFAALRSNGSVVTWGNSPYGGNSSAVDFDGSDNTLSVRQIVSTFSAFAALRNNGSVVTWGSYAGGNSSGVDFDGVSNNLSVTQIFSTTSAFAALRSDGSVVTWGASNAGGSSSGVDFDGPSNNLSVVQIFSSDLAFAALRSDGSIVTWGDSLSGGNSSGLDFDGPNNNLVVTQVFSTNSAFAALRSDGSVVTWGSVNSGGDSSRVDFDGSDNNLFVTKIFSNSSAFAALRNDGSIVTWGHPQSGGYSTGVDLDGPNDDLHVVAFANPFTDDRLTLSVAPAITLSVASAQLITEVGNNNLLFTFSRSGPTTSPLLVNYTVAGTATLGTDYAGIASSPASKSISFAIGSSTATVSVDPLVDAELESDETVFLSLIPGSGYTITTTEAVGGTILDSSASMPPPTIDAIAGDDLITITEALSGFIIQGTGVPGASILFAFSSGTNPISGSTTVVDLDGKWSVAISSEDVYGFAEGAETVEITQQVPGSGFTSERSSRTFTIESAPMPIVDVIAGDNILSPAESRQGFSITGSGVPGASIQVNFASGLTPEAGSLVEVDPTGHWSLPVSAADLSQIGTVRESIAVYQVIPQLGFTSSSVSHDVLVERVPAPTVVAITGDDLISVSEFVDGFVISGFALPDSTIDLKFDSGTILDFGSSVHVGSDGIWSVPIVAADVIDFGLGLETLFVSQTIPGAGFTSDVASHSFTVTSINLPPTAVALTNSLSHLQENTPPLSAIKVADITISDDSFGSNSITLAGADASFFQVVGNQLFLRAGTTLDFESKNDYSLAVSVADVLLPGSVPSATTYSLSLLDLNEAPSALHLSATTVDENVPAGSSIALLSVEDPDQTTQSLTYALVPGTGSTHNLLFSLTGNLLRLIGSPNYETRSSYAIRLRVTDQDGLSFERPATISVNDLPETPTYSLSKSADVVYEWGALSIGVSSANGPAGTRIYWSLTGTNITAGDFSDAQLLGDTLLGDDGKASFTKVVASDGINEADETLEVKFFTDPARTEQIGTTLAITLKDLAVGLVTDGPDIITGTIANEVLTGVPTHSTLRGQSSVDRLTGGGGQDQFLLGDGNGAYYNDGNPSTNGSADLAVITDFNVGDSITLHGSASHYQLSRGSYGSVPGLWIQSLPAGRGVSERIAFVQGQTLNTLNLNDATQFNYLNA